MSNSTALVISLKYNPGHFSHLAASYRLLEELGYHPHLLIHPAFNHLDPNEQLRRSNKLSQLRALRPISLVIFWFPSLRNISTIVRLRCMSTQTHVLYVFHEPFESIKIYRASGFGWAHVLKIVLVNLVSTATIALCDAVLLPSLTALATYKAKYTRLNSNYWCVPLLFDDERATSDEVGDRRFFSYIGTIAADHAFDRYVSFVQEAVDRGWLPNITFLIATRSCIPHAQRAILEEIAGSGRVVIQAGRPMSTKEINEYYRRSLMVWNAYYRSTQSGVLPKAYMFGTPVIALNRNANEFLEDRKTCVLIEDNANVSEIRSAVEWVAGRFDELSRHCRERFLGTFYYRSHLTTFSWLLAGLTDWRGPHG